VNLHYAPPTAWASSCATRASSVIDVDDVEDLLRAGHPEDDLLEAVFGQRPHPRPGRLFPDLRRRRPLCHQRLDGVVDHQNLEDADPALVPDLAAELAPDGPVDGDLAVACVHPGA